MFVSVGTLNECVSVSLSVTLFLCTMEWLCHAMLSHRILILICASQAIALVLRLSHRASRVFKAFSDDEVIKVLSALMILGQHDEELLAAMEKHLPGVVYFPQLGLGKLVEIDSTVFFMHCRF